MAVAAATVGDQQFVDLPPGAGGVPANAGEFPVDGATVQGLASVAGYTYRSSARAPIVSKWWTRIW